MSLWSWEEHRGPAPLSPAMRRSPDPVPWCPLCPVFFRNTPSPHGPVANAQCPRGASPCRPHRRGREPRGSPPLGGSTKRISCWQERRSGGKNPGCCARAPPSVCTSSVPGTRSRRTSRRLWRRTRHQDGPWCGGLGRPVCGGPGPVDGTTARCGNKRGGSWVRSSRPQVIGRCGPRGRGGRGAGGVRWVVTPGGTAHEDGPSRRCPKAAQDGSSPQEHTGLSEGPNGRPRPRRLQSRPTRPRLSPRTSCLRIPWPPARRLCDDAGRPIADGPLGRPRRQADSPHASRCPGGCLMASAGP